MATKKKNRQKRRRTVSLKSSAKMKQNTHEMKRSEKKNELYNN